MRKKPFFSGNPPANTFIGAVGATSDTSASDLAAKLSLSRWHIKNFKIDANDNVSCHINRNYSINDSAFENNNIITYYIDINGKCTHLTTECFHNNTNSSKFHVLVFPNVTSCGASISSGGGAGTRNKAGIMCFPKMEPIGITGTTSQNNFSWCDFNANVYVNDVCATNNAGGPDFDLVPPVGAVSSAIATWVKYSSNTNSPSGTTGLYTISATTTSIELGWDAVTHTNAIDYYAVFRDGNLIGAPNTTSITASGLTSATTYEFKILTIDEMGNNSKFSNIFTETTL